MEGPAVDNILSAAREFGADIIVMLHPDNQYDPGIIPDLVAPIADFKAYEKYLTARARMRERGASRRIACPSASHGRMGRLS